MAADSDGQSTRKYDYKLMELRWLAWAWTDIERLFEFLVDKNPVAAEQVLMLILAGAEQFLETPEISKPMLAIAVAGNSTRRAKAVECTYSSHHYHQ